MGYDVTFHPVSLEELQHFVFDVIDRPELAYDRADEITENAEKRRAVERIYERFPEWIKKISAGDSVMLGSTFAYAAAALAGFLHPYWYARNSAISMLSHDAIDNLLVPLNKLPGCPDCIARLRDPGRITENFTASGFIDDPGQLEAVLIAMGSGEPGKRGNLPLFRTFDETNLASLREAIAYCREHGLGIIEAGDVVVPIVGEWVTDPDNLREAEGFDEVSPGERQWFEAPKPAQPSALQRWHDPSTILLNDTVTVRRLLGRNRKATVVPLNLVIPAPKTAQIDSRKKGVLYEDGRSVVVGTWRLRLATRSASHREYWRGQLEQERQFFEDKSREDLGIRIRQAKWLYHSIAEGELRMGLEMGYALDRQLADAYFGKALLAADMLLEGNVLEGDSAHYPGNVAKILRVKALAQALMGKPLDAGVLTQACDAYQDYARTLRRADWHEYQERDYADFVLTALIADRAEQALEMLKSNRPIQHQLDFLTVYRTMADGGAAVAENRGFRDRCAELLELLRHPGAVEILPISLVAPVLFARLLEHRFAKPEARRGMRELVDWLGR